MSLKLKRIIAIIAASVVALTAVALLAVFSRKRNDKDDSAPVHAYTVSYRMVENGKVQGVYAPLFKKDGTYPTSYTEGETIVVSDLNGRTSRTPVPESWGWDGAYISTGEFTDPYNRNRTFEFLGWFLDKECQNPLDSVSARNRTGDITLYAKISVGYWTNFY